MSDQIVNDECLELIDAMEIGFTLSDYEWVTDELIDDTLN
ncbi:hypothetical protein VIAQ111709_13255 [Vibrio aquimaris]|uniref:Uncharacterized protein n=1 Tax=Vibrio aquimaris TaxID=2587862 RepID=A0A5P9CPK7_9VIBR|nr:hypothetical protein FIV01_16110 [Vibrio aquimaris]